MYLDADGDHFGNSEQWIELSGCPSIPGYSADPGDCDDKDGLVYPTRREVCDGVDQDCDDHIDDGIWIDVFADSDGDGHGDPAAPVHLEGCTVLEGTASVADDCDDADPFVYPGAPELCDGVPQGCVSPFDEAGRVTRTSPRGEVEDLSAVWGSGTYTSPTVLALDAGEYRICPGTYYVRLELDDDVTLTGPGPAGILDAAHQGRLIDVSADEARPPRLTVADLTLRGGAANRGGAIRVSRGSLTLERVTLTGNDADEEGAAILVEQGEDVTLDTVTVERNVALAGEGVVRVETETLLIRDSWFGYNIANGGSTLFIDASDAALSGTTFAWNGGLGPGALTLWGTPAFTISDCVFDGNEGVAVRAVESAGGLSSVDVSRNGSGVVVEGGSLSLDFVEISGHAGVALTSVTSSISLNQSSLLRNTAGVVASGSDLVAYDTRFSDLEVGIQATASSSLYLERGDFYNVAWGVTLDTDRSNFVFESDFYSDDGDLALTLTESAEVQLADNSGDPLHAILLNETWHPWSVDLCTVDGCN